MTSEQENRERIFAEAAELTDPAQRAAYLESACGTDLQLRAEIEDLLRHDEAAGSFLVGSEDERNFTNDYAAVGELGGTQIGPYTLREQIGEGGFGLVFVAEQQEPVRRLVALKIIKPGMDSREVLARFAAERQALAMMDHPNIARVFDGGSTADGRPYFVMELVRGISITDYCDQRHLTPRERLALFVSVCQAVQHAHQKGVIHRDIKPSNVLVTTNDDRPTVKVIDFGVAKAIGAQLTDQTIHTRIAQMIGTPLYMSPEQAELGGTDIDTRSDIYSLGVLLYELLTGTTPFDKQRLQKAAFDEIRRIIREVEPEKPSTRLSSSDSLPSVAAMRHTEPAKLSRLVRGDLDWITMKCLEKDRTRRYETANGLAADVLRHLADEPVSAGPPSARYRLRKFVRRNRGPVLAASLLMLALIVGAVGTAWGWQLALIERDEKDIQRQIATAVKDFLQRDLLKLAAAADQAEQQETGVVVDPDLKVCELVLRAARQVEGKFTDQPLVEAEIRQTLGWTLRELGLPDLAIPHQERARSIYAAMLGADDPKTLVGINDLAVSYSDVGRHAEAQPLREHVLKLRTANLGPDHRDTLSSMNNLANGYSLLDRHAEALALREATLKLRKAKLGADDPHTLTSMHNLASSYSDLGRHVEALALYKATLSLRKAKLGPDHPNTLGTMTNLGASYAVLGQHKEALPLREETLELQTVKLGPDHPITLKSMNNLANSYSALGRHAEALSLREKMVKLLTAKLGREHAETLRSMNTVAISFSKLGRRAEALALREEILKLQTAKFGSNHPDTANTTYGIACVHAFMIENAVDREKQADLAMDWLKRAVASGYKSVAHMKKDSDFAALRERDDFKKLVQDLEKSIAEKK